jgi:hypothetical protein
MKKIKLYYCQSWFGFNIYYQEMHALQNMHIATSGDYDIENFKKKMIELLGTDNIEFIRDDTGSLLR